MNKLELNKKTMQKLNKREMEQVNGGLCLTSCKSGSAKHKKCCLDSHDHISFGKCSNRCGTTEDYLDSMP